MRKGNQLARIVMLSVMLLAVAAASCSSNTEAPYLVSIVLLPKAPTIQVGEAQQYATIATYSDGSVTDVTRDVLWESSDPGVASINEVGLVTAKANGTTVITARFDGMGHSVRIDVGAQAKEMVSISIAPRNASVVVGQSQQYAAVASYSDGSTSDVTGAVTWASSSSVIASIDSAGLAIAAGEGNATITATLGGKSDSVAMAVVAPTVIPKIPASHSSYTLNQCASCHATGSEGAPVWPAGHPPDSNCTLAGCHVRA